MCLVCRDTGRLPTSTRGMMKCPCCETIPDLIDRALLRKVAERRRLLHIAHASSRPLSEDYEYVGLIGEATFGLLIGQEPDLSDKPGGDDGRDFSVRTVKTREIIGVDVKTARIPTYLIHDEKAAFTDAYVLAHYFDDGERAKCIGWEVGKRLLEAPTRDFGYGIVSHFIHASELRPMATLLERLHRGAP